jgi:hypothetical protein
MGIRQNSYYPEWIHDRGLRSLYLLLPLVLLSSSYQGFDGMIMNGLQLLPSWRAGKTYTINYVVAEMPLRC